MKVDLKLVYVSCPIGDYTDQNINYILSHFREITLFDPCAVPMSPYLMTGRFLVDDDEDEKRKSYLVAYEVFRRKMVDELYLVGEVLNTDMQIEIKWAKKFGIPIHVFTVGLEKEYKKFVELLNKQEGGM